MLKPPPCTRTLRLVGDWSVVCLDDGQVGVKHPYSIQPGVARIVLADGSERLLPKTTPVLLLTRPEDLAAAYVQAANAIINGNGPGQP